jgi:hypothetical protein
VAEKAVRVVWIGFVRFVIKSGLRQLHNTIQSIDAKLRKGYDSRNIPQLGLGFYAATRWAL